MSALMFGDRLAHAIAWRFPDDVITVHDAGLIIITRGTVNATAYVPRGDRRRAVTDADVSATIDAAASKLARDTVHYRPEFVAPARELVAIIRAAARTLYECSCWDPDHARITGQHGHGCDLYTEED